MAKTFHIPEINPIYFRQLIQTDAKYNTIPFYLKPTPNTVNGCYYQKWQYTDDTLIQFLSDYDVATNGLTIEVFKLGGKSPVAVIVPVIKVTLIANQTFQVYEAQFDFSDYGYGHFYANISYTDENNVLQTYQSEAWHTVDTWEDTTLLQYKNSFNNYSVVFETGIEFSFRAEMQVREYSPDFNDEVYVDQEYIPTQLSSVPFKKVKLVTRYFPDWALTILNAALNVDEKRIDNLYFEKLSSSKLEINRVDGFEYGYATIEIVPIRDFFLQRLIVDDMPNGLFTIITKRLQWINNAVNRDIIGVFRENTNLRRIDIVNKTSPATAFTVDVGTTPGGSELGFIDVSVESGVLILHKLFDSATSVYLTGLAGNDANVFVIFDQDDEADININAGSASFRYPKGHFGYFVPVDATHLSDVWDLASGLGKPNTDFENCAICDGRNGTENELNAYAVSINDLGTASAELGEEVGENDMTLLIDNLPNEGIGLFAGYVNNSGGDQTPGENDKVARIRATSNQGVNYEVAKAPNGITQKIGKSFPLGAGDAFDNRPKSFKKLPFLAITD